MDNYFRYRKRVYCSAQFIQELAEHFYAHTYRSYEEHKFLKCILNLIFHSSIQLVLDITKEELKRRAKLFENSVKKGKQNNAYKIFYDIRYKSKDYSNITLFCSDSNVSVPYIDIVQKKIDEESLNAIFLTNAGRDVCESVMQKYGVLAICRENMDEFYYLCNDNGQAINAESQGNWTQLFADINKKWNNSLIIIDNYLLNNTKYLDDNLYPIISSFLNNHCEDSSRLQVSIFSSCKESNINWHDAIYKKIFEKYGDKIILSIFKIKSDEFHDRVILTNSLWVECGSGFDLYKREGGNLVANKTTTLHIVSPFFCDNSSSWCLCAYQNIVKHIISILPDMKQYDESIQNEFSYQNLYIGFKENRIFYNQNN